jgi:hypothetical protein
MGNLFDPNNPRTWPENFKRRPTEAFTNVGVEGRDLAKSMVNNRFSSNAQTPVYNAGGDFNLRGMQTPYENYDLKPSNLVKAGLAAVGPGTAKNIINGTYLFGKTVVHGSPEQGLKEIVPRTGSGRFPDDEIAYGWNPLWDKRYSNPGPGWSADAARPYTGYDNTGSIYVGKVPRKNILIDPDENMGEFMIMSSKPIKVTDEVKQGGDIPGFNWTTDLKHKQQQAMKEAIVKALRRQGVGVIPKNKIGPFVDKNMDKIKESLYKFLNETP